jgi:hypothetical protein
MNVKLTIGAVTAVLIMFSGCSDKDSANACSYEISQALDKKDYDNVINNTNSCSGFSEDEKNMNLGAAYFGKAGYTVTSLVSDLASGDSGNESGSDLFLKSFAKKGSQNSYDNLVLSEDFYTSIIPSSSCIGVGVLTQLEKDACFNIGLVQMARGASTIALLFSNENDLDTWLDGGAANINTSATLSDGTTVSDAIATSLEEGIDTVVAILPKKDDGDDADITEDSKDVKDEIFKNSSCSTVITGNCVNQYVQNTNSN